MVYFIVEDISSGYDFYTHINKLILGNRTRVLTGGGVGGISKLLDNINLNKEDIIILSMDYTGHVSTLNIIKKLKKLIETLGVKVIFTDVFCYEEILLSSIKLMDWVEMNENQDELLKGYRKYVRSKEDWCYSDICEENLKNFIKDLGTKLGKYPNREKVSAAVLEECTKNTPFRVNKSNLSECFTKDCCTRDPNCSYPEKGRVRCKIYELPNRLLAEEKMYDILNTSIFSRKVDIIKLIDITCEQRYIEVYFKDILIKEFKINMKEIINIHDSLANPSIYGLDLFERVYNYTIRDFNEKSSQADKKIGIKSF